jgi:hypothetical protein
MVVPAGAEVTMHRLERERIDRIGTTAYGVVLLLCIAVASCLPV